MLNDFIAEYGPALGEAHYYVYVDWVDTLNTWQEYKAFFSVPGRVRLLNEVDGQSSFLIQKSLFHSVIFGICRLVDTPAMGTNVNASLQALKQFSTPQFLPDLVNKVDAAVTAATNIKNYRNKLLAHNDLATMQGAMAGMPIGFPFADVDASLIATHDVFNYLSAEVTKAQLMNEVLGEAGGAEFFLKTLLDGYLVRKQRQEALENGQHIPWLTSDQLDNFTA